MEGARPVELDVSDCELGGIGTHLGSSTREGSCYR